MKEEVSIVIVKKVGGKVYGASLTAAEKKAMNIEIQRQLAEYERKRIEEIDSMILWVLHSEFGFGPERLKRFYDRFANSIDELIKRYEMEDEDQIWLCTHMLKEYGVNIEKWHNERKE